MVIRIKSIFEKFEQDIHELAFYADIVKESYDKYLSIIEKNNKDSEIDVHVHSSKRPVYFDIKNKHEKIISDLRVTKTLDQTHDDVFFHLNKQMQCLLVEAYELYENFIEKLYAVMGYLDNDFWNASDFGEIQLSDIVNKDENWFFEQINKNKEKPYSILKVFEKRFSLTGYSDKKTPAANYQFLMKLISELRHAIVHERGFLDRTVLKKKLLKQQGINGNRLINEYEKYIKIFYGKNEYKSLICLTTIRSAYYVGETPVLPLEYDRRLILTQHILSYAYLLTQLSIEYLEKNRAELK